VPDLFPYPGQQRRLLPLKISLEAVPLFLSSHLRILLAPPGVLGSPLSTVRTVPTEALPRLGGPIDLPIPFLHVRMVGALTGGARFRYFGDRLICEACEHQNPQSRVRSVPRELLAPRTICINFIPGDGVDIQAMHMDHRTMLGPHIRVQSAETLRRLLAYLGATPAQLAELERVNTTSISVI
jgi:hypothetical protein